MNSETGDVHVACTCALEREGEWEEEEGHGGEGETLKEGEVYSCFLSRVAQGPWASLHAWIHP